MYSTAYIEQRAVLAVENALVKCPYIHPYLSANDRTPSWDGYVLVYRDTSEQKSALMGNSTVQIKGTTCARRELDTVLYSVSTVDLKNYHRDGGTIYFVVTVDLQTGNDKVYYCRLLPFDLQEWIAKAADQKSITMPFSELPSQDHEIMYIFMDFVRNKRKQMSFADATMPSLKSLQKENIPIAAIKFNTIGIFDDTQDMFKFISAHDTYLYAEIAGNIDVPIDKVLQPIIQERVNSPVSIGDNVYYIQPRPISLQNGGGFLLAGCFAFFR